MVTNTSFYVRTVKNRANSPSSILGSVCGSRRRGLICEEYERNEDLPKEFWLDKTIASQGNKVIDNIVIVFTLVMV